MRVHAESSSQNSFIGVVYVVDLYLYRIKNGQILILKSQYMSKITGRTFGQFIFSYFNKML
jgi:hypothetical protein